MLLMRSSYKTKALTKKARNTNGIHRHQRIKNVWPAFANEKACALTREIAKDDGFEKFTCWLRCIRD